MQKHRVNSWGWLECCLVAAALGGCAQGASAEAPTPLEKGDPATTGAAPTPVQPPTNPVSGAKAVPGQLVVKFKASGPQRLTEDSFLWIRERRSFATATADRSASLDGLMLRHQVQQARPLVHGRIGLSTSAAKAKLGARLTAVLGAKGRSPKTTPELVNTYRIDVPPGSDLEAVAADFRRDPHVEYAHPNYEMVKNFVPNDPYFASAGSWGQPEQDLWGLSYIGMTEAWDSSRGAGTVVAVVDTGLDLTHPDIAENVWTNLDEIPGNGVDDDGNGYVDDVNGWDTNGDDPDTTDGDGHGTHVSGTIAAQDDNETGVAGVAPDALIMPVKGLGDFGNGSIFDLAEGIVYAAANGADVINNSWGCTGGCPSLPVVEDAVSTAHAAGSVVVFAAGNDNQDIAGYSPQNRPETIVVSATNPFNQRASFSNFGFVDVAAPGAGTPDVPGVFDSVRGILSLRSAFCTGTCPVELWVGDRYLRQSGTSMAAPHVSGLAALIVSQHPEYTPEQVRQVIRRSASDIGNDGFDTDFGYGFINAAQAMLEPTPLEALVAVPSLIEEPESLLVTGTAAGADFSGYVVEYGPGVAPATWNLIGSSTVAVSSGTLGTWLIAGVSDGDYTVRVRAFTLDGRSYEDRAFTRLDRLIVTEPVKMSVHNAKPITIRGSAASAGFDHFAIRIETLADGVPLANPQIALTGGGHAPVENGVLAVWTPTDVPADHYRIVLEETLEDGTLLGDGVSIVVDRRVHDGWPIVLENGGETIPVAEHAVLADLNGDGLKENIVAYARQVNVFRADGTELPGWPQTVNPDGVAAAVVLDAPAVGDIDGDGSPEVVVPAYDGRLWAWNANGTLQTGFPQQRAFSRHDVTLADVDRNGRLDIVFTDFLGSIDVIRGNGTSLTGFPVSLPLGLTGPATVADLDHDGDMEIVASLAIEGFPYDLVAFDHRGRPLPGFPVNVAPVSTGGANAVVGDINDDGDLEIVVSAAGFQDIDAGVVAAYDHTGQPVAGWPKPLPAFQIAPPVLGDLDGDGSLEVLVGVAESSGRGALYVWNGAGAPMPGWPVYTPSSITFTSEPFLSPIIFNADSDHRNEVIAVRLQDFWSTDLFTPFGKPIQGYEHNGVSIPDLARPTYGNLPFFAWDMCPGVGEMDGDGKLEMVWLEDQTFANGKVLAHLWDLDTPATAKLSWPMFRGDARHSGVAEAVVPIVPLKPSDRDRVMRLSGLQRFRITTGNHGIIQIVHPYQAAVTYGINDGAPQRLPNAWGGPVQLRPFTTYLVRVMLPGTMDIRVSWW